MSLLLLDETAGDLPVRDTNQKPSVITAIQGSVSLARTRRQITRVSRTELEDGFLRLHDENLLLKEFARKQEDRIKRMGTKLSRLSHERAQVDGRPGSWVRISGRNLDLEEDLEQMQERVQELERRNEGLRSRLLFYKQQLQLQSCGRHCPYGYVTPRVNTGLRRAHTAAGRVPERQRKGKRALEGVVSISRKVIDSKAYFQGWLVTFGSRSHHSLVLAELEREQESLSSTHGKETDPESTHSQHRYLEVQERRAAIRDNVELIRLQKLLRAKNSELVITKAQYTTLQEAYEIQLQQNQEALRSTSEALLAQVEELNTLLKEETQKAERDLLKMDYDKILESCITAAQQNLDDVPQKDNIPCLEEQLSSVIAEKKNLEEQLEKEIARNDELKQEVHRLVAHVQEVNSPQEKAVILEDPAREEEPFPSQIQSLYLEEKEEKEIETVKEEILSQQNLKRKLHETEAAHAETVLELEKTRDMLILQHRINRDYQAELESVLLQSTREKQEHEGKQEQMARLLDLQQLKDVAYGTRAVPFRVDEVDASVVADNDKAPQLKHGENLLELHISGAVLSAELLRLLGDPEPITFCTYSFYDFETHCTPVVQGIRPRYNFTSQYVVQVDPFFLQYLQEVTCANGEDYGLLEYWVRLRFPIEQMLRLHRQRTKALGYLSAGVPRSTVAQLNWQEEKAKSAVRNEVRVRIEGCTGLRSRWLGSQPSPYAMYQFFTFPDHDTMIIPASNNPHFGDLQTFALCVTPELHHYLLVESLWVYVFDDEDEEPGSYLGKAQVPLLPLANGRSISGDFVLIDPADRSNGSVRLTLEWIHPYMPPKEVASEEIREEDEEALAVEETATAESHRGSEAESSTEVEAGVQKDTASEEPDSTSSEAQTTESDEVVEPSDRIRVEIISLSLLPESQPAADEQIQQLYVEYRFPGVPLEETETPFSLRKPQGNQEIYFHFSKVIKLDPDSASLQRQLLFSMLEAEEPKNQLQFVVVSEPLPGAGGECEEVGFAYLDLRDVLLTGCDVLERELWVVSAFDPEMYIGKLKVSIEAAAALRTVHCAGKSKKSEDG
ncbi:hypothetical protein JD844_001096 [Phrynosoma platyrhinos]|uniref:C2 domain-containing protein n=1 Tax=Phrynosoma platyrhinos TaxID=52577 RepID=A0ABQ7T947_PHRPL|nr:hypothetical protein JD844_001096 [Phrynosoma platyrhinos]